MRLCLGCAVPPSRGVQNWERALPPYKVHGAAGVYGVVKCGCIRAGGRYVIKSGVRNCLLYTTVCFGSKKKNKKV